ncbi:MAG: hypothetical protein NZ853_07475 [Leptospiraceae bacterium]|nr:hypothetical protein [Leptospiraceae bacterium]MDW7975725.1 hypothetical protein [Leptospiraceae bacterium]
MEKALPQKTHFSKESQENHSLEPEKDNYEDPLLLRKQGLNYIKKKDIEYYRKLLLDEKYLDHAIRRIAMEISHFILKDR